MAKSKLIKFELNRAGVGALLKSPEMQNVLSEYARHVAGPGDRAEVYVAGTRAVAEVHGQNKDNALLKRLKS